MKVTVANKSASQAYELLDKLRAAGLVNGRDFTWYYSPQKCDYFGSVEKESYVEFDFLDEQNATYFRLKWA